MNIKLMALVVGIAGVTAMSACTKCKVCTKDDSDEVRVCEKDYNNQTAYGLAIDGYEFQGYDCSEAP